ncbi:cobalt-precorrin-5B (C(1))-methyltransferase CbiD [Methanobacterium sp. ACI-7]|uniref:cobalt-precorrin-5B (C(1))-methyltransferase CbiD n=1 Tax=unclassified Methanobacterium TaxID=2627676 RepID=UPI0039C2262A
MEIHSGPLDKELNNDYSGELQLNKSNSPYGITTGSAATAASLAAFLSTIKSKIPQVTITSPFGKLNIHIHSFKKLNSSCGMACVVKMPYNDPDVTKNLKICAEVRITDSNKIIIKGGEGVGTVTKPGLQIPVGEPAINPVPQQMIKSNLQNVLPDGKGAEVTIFIPRGKEIAKKTMNPRLGIEEGISILGTTGIARPMSSHAYKESLVCQIDVALAEGFENLVFVPGNIGERIAKEILEVEEDQIVQMGNFVGFMLDKAQEKEVKQITLLGHAGKIIKIAAGIFNTKNSVADGRREIIAAHCGLLGADKNLIEEIYRSKTTEDMIDILDHNNLTFRVFSKIAAAVKEKCQERVDVDFEITIVRMDGTILNKS